MAELDPLNIKLFTKEDRRCEYNQHHKWHEEKPRLKAQRLPKIAYKRKNRERDGQNLIEEKNQPKGLRSIREKLSQGLGTRLPPSQVVRDQSKNQKSKKIRNGKCEKAKESKLRCELN